MLKSMSVWAHDGNFGFSYTTQDVVAVAAAVLIALFIAVWIIVRRARE
jgi:hypothetical protein